MLFREGLFYIEYTHFYPINFRQLSSYDTTAVSLKWGPSDAYCRRLHYPAKIINWFLYVHIV